MGVDARPGWRKFAGNEHGAKAILSELPSAASYPLSTVHEIEVAIPRLSRSEQEQLREWLDEFLEDQLELTDEVKAKLDESRREIAEGNCRTRQPE